VGERRRDGHAENLLLPCTPDHLLAAGDGHRPVADYLHPAGSLARSSCARWQIRQSCALQSKINPHFLFNALNAISSSIRLNPDTARQLIFNLSRYLRYNIELKDDEQIDIKKELYQIKDYIAIEQARFGDKLTVIYDIDEEVNCVIPSLLIQPLVENALFTVFSRVKAKAWSPSAWPRAATACAFRARYRPRH
jgi:hypothetical protein